MCKAVSRYLEILATQRPFEFAIDESNRTMHSVNFEALVAADVNQFEEEMAARMISEGAATAIGTDIFIGRKAEIPIGDGPYISITDTGGARPERAHNTGIKYERLSFQVVVRAKNYVAARTRALAVWRALDGLRNITVAP